MSLYVYVLWQYPNNRKFAGGNYTDRRLLFSAASYWTALDRRDKGCLKFTVFEFSSLTMGFLPQLIMKSKHWRATRLLISSII